jgi:hypothetical protein
MKLGLGLTLQKPPVWRESYKLEARSGLIHMSMITCNEDLDDDSFFVPCLGQWTPTKGIYEKRERVFVTCIVCVMFLVHEGRISLWVPSPSSCV